MKAVIIDPVAYQRRILARILEASGHEAIEERAEIGDALVSTSADDLLFIEAARLDDPAVELDRVAALIIVTGAERDEAEIASQLRRGAHAFLSKPYTAEGLKAALADGRALRGDPSS